MKLVCSQSELSASLQLVSRAVAGRPTHPVLANVLLTADAGTGRLSLTGFDLSLGIQTSFNASVETSGAITLPARLFGEIVSVWLAMELSSRAQEYLRRVLEER